MVDKTQFKIAVIPGDGVGTEVASEAVKAGIAAAKIESVSLKFDWFDWGCDYYLKHGKMMPDDVLVILKDFDAIFLGCIGDASKVPDHISLKLLLTIRKGFDQYVNLRPIYLYEGVSTPLKDARPGDIDLVVVRENVEGEYAQVGGRFKKGTDDEVAVQTAVFTRKGTERVIRYAFELARKRKKLSGKNDYTGMVTNCSKSNALNYSMVFWDEVFNRVAEDYSDIKKDFALVDALTMWFVKNPEYFDVVVASNLFGDIITDLGAMLQGGMGFAAGGNINPDKVYPSMFEPIHGSAPKYAGKNVINPFASIEAMRMLLDHIGLQESAQRVQKAIQSILSEEKVKTRDMGGNSKTSEVGDAIVSHL
ncbi:MAG: 3-isopropylmalate dehydrogenase [Spirochaetota bacterium]|nr:MAG: 3-isopropylmalate dehydrogenase [Spirochaetota bacterium]